jgi:hypothetical protein
LLLAVGWQVGWQAEYDLSLVNLTYARWRLESWLLVCCCCFLLPAVGWQLWQLDMTSQQSVDALMKRMKDTYGRIDFLFLNAGALFV